MDVSPSEDTADPRLAALRATGLLDTAPEPSYDRLTALAARLLNAPMALVSLVDAERLFFKSAWGLDDARAAARQTTLAYSYCQFAVAERAPFIVEDARTDARVQDNRATTEMGVVSYAGIPLFGEGQEAIGTLCVLGTEPRRWTEDEIDILRGLAAAVQAEIDLRQELSRSRAALGAQAAAEERALGLLATLEERERQLRQMIDVVPHFLFIKDEQGRFLIANEAMARAHGTTPQAMVGRTDEELGVEPERAARYRADDLDVIDRGKPQFLSGGTATNADGEVRVFETLKVPFTRDGTHRPAVLGLVRDITEERERERQFRRAERMASLGTLVGGVAHELNNPLSAVKGLSQLMLMDPRSDDDTEALETIHHEADRMARIVADLRLLARQSQEAEAPPRGPVDLNELVHHVLRVRAYSLSTHNAVVVEDLQPDLAPVLADSGRLEQVLLNLIVNAEQAISAATPPGTITIRTRSRPRGVSVSVQDTGPGIPTEHLERIFDPFWTTKAPGEGTGLGLSLVHDIVTAHGGTIRVDSEPGHGARFTVLLPAAGSIAPATDAHEPSGPAPERSLSILVVDDEAPVRATLVRYLRRRGHRVDEAADGAAALEHIEAARAARVAYDAIVSDLRMPGLDGAHLLARLREQDEGMDRRLIFLTGDAASPAVERLLADAQAPVLMKPFEFSTVAAMIREVVTSAEQGP